MFHPLRSLKSGAFLTVAGMAALLTAPLLSIPRATAVPGDLDRSFGGFGYQAVVSTPVASEGMAVTPDGRIVTAGTSGVQIIVRRYMPNGTLDASFGAGGTATLLNPSFAMHANAVAVQADGKIVVAGWADTPSKEDYLVLRVTTTGAVDASFGSGGYRTTDFAGSDDRAAALVIQPDGKIVLAGESNVGGDDDFSVARFTSGGSLDPGFSGNGRLTIPFGGEDRCRDVALQPDGKIVVLGDGSEQFPEYDTDLCLARINPDGTLDGDFDADGMRDFGFGSAGDRGTALAILPDGSFLVAGHAWEGGSSYSGKVAHVIPNNLDPDLIVGVSGSKKLWDIAVRPDGRYLLLGESSSAPGEIAVFGRTSGDAADPTFSLDGRASYDAGFYDQPRNIELLPDGRILAHAISGPDFFSPNTTVMVRLWPEGTPDEGGYQAFGFDESGSGFPPGSIEDARGMVIQPDGKIVVAGFVAHPSSGESDFGCVRFLPDGELDPSFGVNGHTTFSFHNNDTATSVALQPDGKIVLAGYTGSDNGVNFLVARFLPNGTLDNTFGFSGFNVIDFMGGPDYGYAVAVAPDGKIVIAGGAFNGVNQVVGVARFGPDGVADTSFDLDARQLVEFEAGATHAGTCVLVQPDRKIVAGGYVNGDFILLRLNESGVLDDTFGCAGGIGGGGVCNGKARVDMGGGDYAYGLGRAPNGWLYLGGSRVIDGPSDFAIAQFTENGVLTSCPPFPCENWSSGKAYLNIGNVDYGFALDVRSDGDIVVAGTADGMFAWGQFRPRSAVAYVAAWTNMAGDESVSAVRFTGYNHLVMAGPQIFNSDRNFALVKFETAPNVVTGVSDPQRLAGNGVVMLGPNPSDGNTRLAFGLAQKSSVDLRVYDASGRLVRAHKVGALPAGRHQASWDGLSNGGVPAPAGVYFVNLSADGRDLGTQKLVMLR
jgi:uncharacterized delta-60 repeat protein